ncbi:MAG TPA: hypothetical protein PK299_00880, partial [Anaerolineales bacterium]|nr:hypothetical protein [Anaerolineales bacterium]
PVRALTPTPIPTQLPRHTPSPSPTASPPPLFQGAYTLFRSADQLWIQSPNQAAVQLSPLPLLANPHLVALSPNQQWLAWVGGNPGYQGLTLFIWDTQTAQIIHSQTLVPQLKTAQNEVDYDTAFDAALAIGELGTLAWRADSHLLAFSAAFHTLDSDLYVWQANQPVERISKEQGQAVQASWQGQTLLWQVVQIPPDPAPWQEYLILAHSSWEK